MLVYEIQIDDASHPHIHIVTTNIKADSTRIDMHNIGKLQSEKARKELELEYHLLKAEGRGTELPILPANIETAAYGEKQTKRSIYNVVTAVLRSYRFTSLAEYSAVLKTFNVIADRGPDDSLMFQKRGLVYSVSNADGKRVGISFKASSLAGKPILNKVESKFASNLEKAYAEQLKLVISKALEASRLITQNEFVHAVGKQGISILFRQNSENRIYGVTYIDHNSRCVSMGMISVNGLARRLFWKESTKDWDEIGNTIVSWKDIENLILKNCLLKAIERRSPLVSEDATNRYFLFNGHFPGLVNRVPLSHVASYLGITQQSLSRIWRNVR